MKKTIAYLLPLAAVLFDPTVASAHERHHDRFNHYYGYGYPAYPPYPSYYPNPVYGYPYAYPAYGYDSIIIIRAATAGLATMRPQAPCSAPRRER